MSTQDTAAPKRRSSAANRRRKRRGTANNPEVQVQESQATEQPSRAERKAAARQEPETAEAPLPQEKHLRRKQERREAKSRQPEKKGGIASRIVNTERFGGVAQFYRDTRSEIRKVEWPDRQATLNLTVLVISLSVVLGLVLGGIDYVLFQLFEAMS